MLKPMANAQRAESDSRPGKETVIVVVDDDEGIREGLKAFFDTLGYDSAGFESAEHYLSSKLRTETGCLVLDVHLPGMSGPDLQSLLIKEKNCAPIVFITACVEQDVRNRVIAAGALDYLIKPFTEKAIINCIEKALSARR
jgi:FixJ family two-component response regulator